MPNDLFKPPRYLIKEWPEVFEGLYMNTLPVEYLEYIFLEFADGRVWQIDIKSQITQKNINEVGSRLLETIQEYCAEIKKIDFKIDIKKLKLDANASTKLIF